MASHQADVAGVDVELVWPPRHSLACRFVASSGSVDAEAAHEQVDRPALLELAFADRQRLPVSVEQPEPMIAKAAQRGGNLGVRWHRCKRVQVVCSG